MGIYDIGRKKTHNEFVRGKKDMKKWILIIGLVFNFNAYANAPYSIEEIKEHVYNQPFDFEQIKTDADAYNNLLFRERERRLQFVEIDKYPTARERRTYYILNAIDVGMTIWALNNRENIKEGNVFLNDNPSNRALISNKLLIIPIYQNMNQGQVVVMNHIVGAVIVHNMYVINKYD